MNLSISDGQIPKYCSGSRDISYNESSSRTIDDGLDRHVNELYDASISKNTKQVYQSGVNGFLNFLKLNKFVNLDVSYSQINEEHFIYFVTYCKYALNLKFETIKLYLAGIRYFLLRYYNTEPLKETPRLDYILRGINKLQVNTSNKRFSITSDVLWKLCDNLQKGMFSPFIDLMLLCIFKKAFFGFLRCGEFTCNERSDSNLFIEDIVFDTKSDIDSYALHLHSSKCDPFHF